MSSHKKLIADITVLSEGARRALIEACWATGKRIVEVEHPGEIKAVYGSGLLHCLPRELTARLGPGFSYTNFKNMRRFYLDSPNRQPAGELTWAHQIELLPVRA